MPIDVTVIIPAFNEERVIGTCLEALTRQDFPKESFEVMLIDNGSTDRTVEIAQAFSPALEITVFKKPGIRISAMRNFGASSARGEALAFLDSDCVPPPEWLKTAASLLRQDDRLIVGAHYKIPENSSWVARAWFGDAELEKQGDIRWLPAGDMIMTRRTFEQIGRFDESIQTNEDCELCDRARAHGVRVRGDASVAVVHLGTPQTLLRFYQKDYWHGADALKVFLRSLPKMSNPRPLMLGCYTLACVAGLVAGIVTAFKSGSFLLLEISFAAWFLPAFLMSLILATRRGRWSILGPLTVLHMAFGLARGHALITSLGAMRRS